MREGQIEKIAGSVITASGIEDVYLGEVVEVGAEALIGEVIRLSETDFTMQVYESTSGLKPGQKVLATGKRLVAELGPGLLTNVLDGIGRQLEPILREKGAFVARGIKVKTLSRDKKWTFEPTVKKGKNVQEGDVLGEVKETRMLTHRIMVPHGMQGVLTEINSGDFTVEEPIASVRKDNVETDVTMLQEWPVRTPRPFKKRLSMEKPLITGQRVIDVFFPIPKGGAASVPGGFGTGKTIILQQLAKWSDADVIVYVGCGERGNEICEVLTDFPKLKDPKTNLPLMERTILIANTSNRPVVAREASIYFGITIAEYYRDMGYNVAVMADSTSRWAEALREISGRLGEMPSEKGYPAYLSERIAGFYERAGRIETLGNVSREGSVTVVGAVSPPGGDFNEPVTIHTLRFTGVFWALDAELAYSRHFPAINWLKSYSLYPNQLSCWATSFSAHTKELSKLWSQKIPEFENLRGTALDLLSESAEVESIAKIIGENALPDDQRLIMLTAELLKEGFLRQNAFDDVDAFCEPSKQVLMLDVILAFHKKAEVLVKKRIPIETIIELQVISKLKRMKEDKGGEWSILQLVKEVDEELDKISKQYGNGLGGEVHH